MKKQLFVLVTILVLLTGCGGGANSNSTRGDPAYWCASNQSIPAFSSDCDDNPNSIFKQLDPSNDEDNEISFLKKFLVYIFLLLALYIFLLVIFLKWVAKTARKNKRSVVGFVWMGFIFPFITWIILLTINEVDNSKSN